MTESKRQTAIVHAKERFARLIDLHCDTYADEIPLPRRCLLCQREIRDIRGLAVTEPPICTGCWVR